MSWLDAPAYVTQFRAQLIACAAWTAAGSGSGQVHFPSFDPIAELIDAKPQGLLVQTGTEYQKWSDGVSPLASGTIELDLYGRAQDWSAGALESLGDALIPQLIRQSIGIPFRNPTRSEASDPTGAADAAGAAYRHLRLLFPFGLSA